MNMAPAHDRRALQSSHGSGQGGRHCQSSLLILRARTTDSQSCLVRIRLGVFNMYTSWFIIIDNVYHNTFVNTGGNVQVISNT